MTDLGLSGVLALSRFFFFDNEPENDGSGSGSYGTCTRQFWSGISIGRVSSFGSGVFFLIGIKSIDDVVPLFVFKTLGVESKVGWLIEIFVEFKVGWLTEICPAQNIECLS